MLPSLALFSIAAPIVSSFSSPPFPVSFLVRHRNFQHPSAFIMNSSRGKRKLSQSTLDFTSSLTRSKKRVANDAAASALSNGSRQSTSKVTTTATSETHKKKEKAFQIYCDMDGVLTDFEAGVQALTGKRTKDLSKGRLWSSIAKSPNFYEHLPWMADGEELWESIRPLRPRILTGCSEGAKVPLAKFEWCKRELCVEVQHLNYAAPKKKHVRVHSKTVHSTSNNNRQARKESLNEDKQDKSICSVITCWSRNKHYESGPGRYVLCRVEFS